MKNTGTSNRKIKTHLFFFRSATISYTQNHITETVKLFIHTTFTY